MPRDSVLGEWEIISIGRGCPERPIEKLYSPNLHGVQSEYFFIWESKPQPRAWFSEKNRLDYTDWTIYRLNYRMHTFDLVNSCSILERHIFIAPMSITQRFLNFQPGEVKTFQRGDLGRHGMFFKIVPKYSYKLHKNHRHFRGCWKRYGTKSRRAKAQSILPCNSAWPFKSRLEDFKVSDCLFKGLPISPT